VNINTENIVILYRSGLCDREIGDIFGYDRAVINRIRLKSGISRTRSEYQTLRWSKQPKQNCNLEKLLTWSSQKAYFLGFLQGDGFFCRGTNKVGTTIHKKDAYLLTEIKDYFQIKAKIRKYVSGYGSPMRNLTIENKKLKEAYQDLGLKVEKIVQIMPNKYFWDFFTGWFDADGSISQNTKSRKYGISICGDFKQLKALRTRLGLCDKKICKDKTIHRLFLPLKFMRENRNKMYRVFGLERKKKLVFAC